MRLIDADKVNETIDRFIGYLDEDMILRIKMKISKIPTVDRPHGECKTCKYYIPYKEQFSHRNRGDGYCKSAITSSEGNAYINCHDEWYCVNYEKEGEAE